MEKLHWGIVGAGRISHDFVTAITNPDGPAAASSKVIAVASQNLDRAIAFAERHSISTAYGSYAELTKDNNIHIVYIGNVTGQHYETCKLMLNAGKSVLCEKSLTTSAAKSKELFDLAAKNHLFFMEALWSNFLPAYRRLKTALEDGVIGRVSYMEAYFGLDRSTVSRLAPEELGGGAALEIGVYLVNLVRLVFNKEQPEEIIARGNQLATGVDASWDAILIFPGGRRAILGCSFQRKLHNAARIYGDHGFIELSEPLWCSERIILPAGEFREPVPTGSKHAYNCLNSAGLAYEAAAVSEAIRLGRTDCDEYTATDSLYVAGILDNIRQQVKNGSDTNRTR